jgi:hypothetical protein
MAAAAASAAAAGEELRLTVRAGFTLAARAWGPADGERWLCLHGWLDNAAAFDFLAPQVGPGPAPREPADPPGAAPHPRAERSFRRATGWSASTWPGTGTRTTAGTGATPWPTTRSTRAWPPPRSAGPTGCARCPPAQPAAWRSASLPTMRLGLSGSGPYTLTENP